VGLSSEREGWGGELGVGGLAGCKISLAGVDCHAPILASCMSLMCIV
jgi:hypothetical protein